MSALEIETRAPLGEHSESVRQSLLKMGFIKESSVSQVDVIHDKPNVKSGSKIRIRVEGSEAELTYKGTLLGRTDLSQRTECSISIGSEQVTAAGELLTSLGFPELFRTPKLREKYKLGSLVATIDHWPIAGEVLELEGDEDSINQTIAHLPASMSFRNWRLSELFNLATEVNGKSFSELKQDYETENNIDLGNLDFLMN